MGNKEIDINNKERNNIKSLSKEDTKNNVCTIMIMAEIEYNEVTEEELFISGFYGSLNLISEIEANTFKQMFKQYYPNCIIKIDKQNFHSKNKDFNSLFSFLDRVEKSLKEKIDLYRYQEQMLKLTGEKKRTNYIDLKRQIITDMNFLQNFNKLEIYENMFNSPLEI